MFGGRPMKLVKSNIFMDVIQNKPVSVWEDKKGRYWMSIGKWGWFRVRVDKSEFEEPPQNAK